MERQKICDEVAETDGGWANHFQLWWDGAWWIGGGNAISQYVQYVFI